MHILILTHRGQFSGLGTDGQGIYLNHARVIRGPVRLTKDAKLAVWQKLEQVALGPMIRTMTNLHFEPRYDHENCCAWDLW